MDFPLSNNLLKEAILKVQATNQPVFEKRDPSKSNKYFFG